MTNTILILNGPNLNMLGTREPDVYGSETIDDIQALCEKKGKDCGVIIDFRQSNQEGEMVTWIQDAKKSANGIIVNAGAYTHTSVAIRDALLSINLPIIELHLSNVFKREEFRHHSYISDVAQGVICGLGSHGYELAVDAMAKIFSK